MAHASGQRLRLSAIVVCLLTAIGGGLPSARLSAQAPPPPYPDVTYLQFNELQGTPPSDRAIPGTGASPAIVGGAGIDDTTPFLGRAALRCAGALGAYCQLNETPRVLTEATFEAWIQLPDFGETVTIFALAWGTTDQFAIQVNFNAFTQNYCVNFFGTILLNQICLPSALMPNAWVHIAVVFAGAPTNGNVSVYADQVLVSVQPYPALTLRMLGNTTIGGLPAPATGPSPTYARSIDEVRIWSSARTHAEIVASLYGEFSPGSSRLQCAATGALVFNPAAQTFSLTDTVIGAEAYGFPVPPAVSASIVNAAVTLTGSWGGADTTYLSDILLNPAVLRLTVIPNSDELAIATAFDVTNGDPPRYVFTGSASATPAVTVALGQSSPASLGRIGSGSTVLDRWNAAVSGGESVTPVFRRVGGQMRLHALELGYAVPPRIPRAAMSTDGFGSVDFAFIDTTPGVAQRSWFVINPTLAVAGTGPFYGLEISPELWSQWNLAIPPFQIIADVRGGGLFHLPSGTIPAGLVVDAMTTVLTPSAAIFALPVIRVAF